MDMKNLTTKEIATSRHFRYFNSRSPLKVFCYLSLSIANSFSFTSIVSKSGRSLALNQIIRVRNTGSKRAYSGNKMTATRKRKLAANKKGKSDIPSILQVPHVRKEYLPEWMNKERTKVLTIGTEIVQPIRESSKNNDGMGEQCVVYWMQRDVRTVDNWAILYAEYLSRKNNVPLKVIYVLPPPPSVSTTSSDSLEKGGKEMPPLVNDINMTQRHGSFLIQGLKLVEEELTVKNVQFDVLMPSSRHEVGNTIHRYATEDNSCIAMICDFTPLRGFREWMEDQASPLLDGSNVPLYQVDAHNIVPCWFASPKLEVGARTLRPKITKLLPAFLTQFPTFEGNSHIDETKLTKSIAWKECESYLNMDESVPSVAWEAGTKAALKRFVEFCNDKTEGLKHFDSLRNDPNLDFISSNMSPWINYGHVSFQRLALDAKALHRHPNGTAAFIEEGIVRRELSDNFIYYKRDNYDQLSAAAQWAQDSLQLHSIDKREYVYTLNELETAQTHDKLWNAAQIQMTDKGMMHGFLRMYWAKKILEWTESPAIALRTALYLNDRYSLDGNDPNGFTGVGWSIMGIHDMGWKERPIFGKIRFMNYAGCRRKFKVDIFVEGYPTKSQIPALAKKIAVNKQN